MTSNDVHDDLSHHPITTDVRAATTPFYIYTCIEKKKKEASVANRIPHRYIM
jgi:hypothetical protein